jgi:hypothetical protein
MPPRLAAALLGLGPPLLAAAGARAEGPAAAPGIGAPVGDDAGLAAAAPVPSLAARARIEARALLTHRRASLAGGGGAARAAGIGPPALALAGRALAPGLPVGVEGRLALERFGLTRSGGGGGEPGGGAGVALAAELAAGARALVAHRRLALWGAAGYGYERLPLPAPMSGAGAPVTVTAHGPLLAAAAEAAAGEALGQPLAVELAARARIVSFGDRHAGRALGLRTLAAAATIGVGRWEALGLHVSGVATYELAVTRGAGGGARAAETLHRLGLGLRASRAPAPRPSVVAAPLPPAPRAPRLRGIVTGAPPSGEGAAAPLAGVVVAAGGRKARTGPDGAFSFDELGPGPVTLRAAADCWLPTDEVVVVPEEGGAEVALTLRRAEAPAALRILVRSERGRPVAASLSIVELGRTVRADARGGLDLPLPPGEYTIVLAAPGFAPQRKRVRVAPGEQSIHNVDLRRER